MPPVYLIYYSTIKTKIKRDFDYSLGIFRAFHPICFRIVGTWPDQSAS